MRTSLTITGLEVELSVRPGPLETIVARRNAPFLGETRAPICSLHIEPQDGLRRIGPRPSGVEPVVERESDSVFRIAHPCFVGHFDLEGVGTLYSSADAAALDHALRILFALLAPRYDGFMLAATSVIGAAGADLFAGDSDAGWAAAAGLAGEHTALIRGYVMIRQVAGRWLSGSTPFAAPPELPEFPELPELPELPEPPGPPREANLARLWVLRTCPTTEPCPLDSGAALHALMDNVVLPGRPSDACRAVLDLASELAATVPSQKLFLAADADLPEEVGIFSP